MSGIAAMFCPDGRPVQPLALAHMVSMLTQRGPDGSGSWTQGSVGLGRTALVTAPERRPERQPLESAEIVLSADTRLDNRDELARALRQPPTADDGGLIAAAYERWGAQCPQHLEGDFAFVLWDRRRRRLFCARDRFGVRPLYIHNQPGRLFAAASEPAAILVLSEVPYEVNEGRIADFLITQLEGIDTTSTFFEGVARLPPAHAMTVDSGGVQRWRYWKLEASRDLGLGSDVVHQEEFLDAFVRAVRRRVGTHDAVGCMLSGGLDSSSVVAVARDQIRQASGRLLPVFSAVGPDPDSCVETATIRVAQTLEGLEPHSVNHADLCDLLPGLLEAQGRLAEPFDMCMTLPRAVYLLAHRHRVRAVLDGIDGDTLLAEGSYILQLVRRGRLLTAWREAVGRHEFEAREVPPWRILARCIARSILPTAVRHRLHRLSVTGQDVVRRNLDASIASYDLAQRVRLGDRLEALRAHIGQDLSHDLPAERARAMSHPFVTVAVERYGRTAAALGIEARHPFLDRPLVEHCIALPGSQKLSTGWPKAILRRVMAGRLPDGVRWRRGNEHLGWSFNAALMAARHDHLESLLHEHADLISAYVDPAKVRAAWRAHLAHGDPVESEKVLEAATLAEWLLQHAERPVPDRRPGPRTRSS